MSSRLIYPIATGRSGTVFLTELLKTNVSPNRAAMFHERVGFPNFGVNSPDASHFTTFNTIGNAPNVEQFWKRKLARDLQSKQEAHIEISHFLCKGGLVENLNHVREGNEVHLVALKRDPFKIAWSFVNRFDFYNVGFTWLFSLDPRYPNVIVPAAPLRDQGGMFGSAIWYVNEMFARMEYYRRLVEPMDQVHFHDFDLETIIKPEGAAEILRVLGFENEAAAVKIPPKANATAQESFGAKEKRFVEQLLEKHWVDPVAAGAEFFESGKRLADPTGQLAQLKKKPAVK